MSNENKRYAVKEREIVQNMGTEFFYEIFVRDKYSSWCKLLWQDNGWVVILSDYGNWAYWWGHRGNSSVPEFLARLDRDYMGKKLLGPNAYEYSAVSTVQCIREMILSRRKTGSLEAGQAGSEWRLVRQLEDGDITFEQWYEQTTLDDGYECHSTEISGNWRHFWERLWVPLVRPMLLCEESNFN